MKNLSLLVLGSLAFSPLSRAEMMSFRADDARLEQKENRRIEASWNECAGPVSGNYSDETCATDRAMNNEFSQFLRENIFSCVNDGLHRINEASAREVHIVHDGVQANSAHSRRSLHAAGRAIDIRQMRVTTGTGILTFDFRITSRDTMSPDRKFYEGFRDCWGQLMRMRGCAPRKSGAPVGTIGWEDSRHRNHHLHTSLPFCPSSRGYLQTELSGQEEEDAEENGPYERLLDI